ncbi:MAG: HAD family hydrolase [Methanomassiliicoccales archaeon]
MGAEVVYLDRDNTLIRDCPYCSRKEDVVLMEGAAEAVAMLNRAGVLAIVVTNQSGIGRGYFTEAQMHEVNTEMERQLVLKGAHIDAIYYCPHSPEVGCECRKPATGLIEMARRDFHPEKEFVIGDRDDVDGEMARRAGIRYALTGQKGILEIVQDYLSKLEK